jgi:hypothetical protein
LLTTFLPNAVSGEPLNSQGFPRLLTALTAFFPFLRDARAKASAPQRTGLGDPWIGGLLSDYAISFVRLRLEGDIRGGARESRFMTPNRKFERGIVIAFDEQEAVL